MALLYFFQEPSKRKTQPGIHNLSIYQEQRHIFSVLQEAWERVFVHLHPRDEPRSPFPGDFYEAENARFAWDILFPHSLQQFNGGHSGATDCWAEDSLRFPRSASTECHFYRLKIANDTTGDPRSLSGGEDNLRMRNSGMQMYGLLGNAQPAATRASGWRTDCPFTRQAISLAWIYLHEILVAAQRNAAWTGIGTTKVIFISARSRK